VSPPRALLVGPETVTLNETQRVTPSEPDSNAAGLFVIASQRVGAKRCPMTGSAKQSIEPPKKGWIASSLRSSQ